MLATSSCPRMQSSGLTSSATARIATTMSTSIPVAVVATSAKSRLSTTETHRAFGPRAAFPCRPNGGLMLRAVPLRSNARSMRVLVPASPRFSRKGAQIKSRAAAERASSEKINSDTTTSTATTAVTASIDAEAVEASEAQLDAELTLGVAPSVAHAAELAAALAEEREAEKRKKKRQQQDHEAATTAVVPTTATKTPLQTSWRDRFSSLLHSPHDAAIVSLALPALGSLLLDPIMTAVDTALVGRLVGTSQLAGVGLSSIALTFFVVLFNPLIFVTTPAVASAAARGDSDEASRVTARGLWVAAVLGTLGAIALFVSAPSMTTWLAKSGSEKVAPTAAAVAARERVARHAAVYIQCRSLGSPALMATFVACGSFRGVRDTRTPLVAALVANVVNLGGDLVLMLWLQWGVAGAALATAASQWVSAAVLVFLLLKRELLRWEHVSGGPPKPDELAPLAKAAAALSVRNVSTMGVIFLGTTMVSAAGAISLAAHEVLRQLYIVSVQAFSALDVATQYLVAGLVGAGDPRSAREVLRRALAVAVAIGAVVGVALTASADVLPAAFTRDPAVAAAAASVLPLLAAFMPVDAAAAVLDGALLGASDTAWVARSTLAVSAVCLVALMGAKSAGAGLFGVWAALKTLSTGRTVAAAVRFSMQEGPLGRSKVSESGGVVAAAATAAAA